MSSVFGATISISDIEYSENGDSFSREFLVDSVSNQLNDYIAYRLDNFDDALPQDLRLSKSGQIIMDFDSASYSATYPISEQIELYTFEKKGTKAFYIGGADSWCDDLVVNNRHITVPISYPNWECYGLYADGQLGTFGSATEQWVQDVIIQPDGGTPKTLTLTQSTKSGNIAGILNVEYIGSLNSLKINAPDPANDYSAYKRSGADNPIVISHLDLTPARNEYGTQVNIINNVLACGGSKNCVTEYMNEFNLVTAGVPVRFDNNPDVRAVVESGKLKLTGEVYSYPKFLLRINADWLGLVVPQGEPVIKSLDGGRFVEGQEAYFTSVVKNDADVDASFSYEWTCDSNDVDIDAQSLSFNGLQTRTINHVVYGSANNQVTQTKCCLEVKSRNGQNTDSECADIEFIPTDTGCTLGDYRCAGGIQPQKCVRSNDITIWDDSSVRCQTLCETDNDGFPVCKDQNVVISCGDNYCASSERFGGDDYCPADCESGDYTSTILIIGGGLLLLGGIYYFTRKPNGGGL